MATGSVETNGLREVLGRAEEMVERHREGIHRFADSIDYLAQQVRKTGRKVPRRIHRLARELRQSAEATAYQVTRTRAAVDALCTWVEEEVAKLP